MIKQKMGETPRTDEYLRRRKENGHTVVVSREFARQLETELADKEKQLAEARAEIDKFNALLNGIECFMTPCEKHSGENTPPFALVQRLELDKDVKKNNWWLNERAKIMEVIDDNKEL